MKGAIDGVEATLRLLPLVDDDAHAVPLSQPGRQPRPDLTRRQTSGVIETLGRLIQFGDMIATRVEEVAHLFERHTGGRVVGELLSQPQGHGFGPVGASPRLAVQRDQRPPNRRHVQRKFAQFSRRYVFGSALPQGFAHIRDQPPLLVFREQLNIDAESGVELEQQRHGQRALVLLDLTEIAIGYSQRLRHRGLGQAALFAQPTQTNTHEGLAHRLLQLLHKVGKDFSNIHNRNAQD